MENLTIGTRVKMVYGMGQAEKGVVADFITNRWGRSAVIHLDNGDVEYTDNVVDSGMGCQII